MSPRVPLAEPPYSQNVGEAFERLMPPGVPPLGLFRALAVDERLFSRFMSGGLLDPGHLTLRQREIVIDRVTARGGSEYEWGVHMALFGDRAELTSEQAGSLVHGGAEDACWTRDDERQLIRLCDRLLETCDLDDDLWAEARTHFTDPALIEILMLAGFYRTVSCLANGLRIPLEDWGRRFPPADETGVA